MIPVFSLFRKIDSVSTKELLKEVQNNIQLIDVRTSNEYQVGHIKQAKNVPLQKIESFKGNFGQEIYVVCQSGMRSKQASKILSKKGYQVKNVRGGMNQWSGEVRRGR